MDQVPTRDLFRPKRARLSEAIQVIGDCSDPKAAWELIQSHFFAGYEPSTRWVFELGPAVFKRPKRLGFPPSLSLCLALAADASVVVAISDHVSASHGVVQNGEPIINPPICWSPWSRTKLIQLLEYRKIKPDPLDSFLMPLGYQYRGWHDQPVVAVRLWRRQKWLCHPSHRR